MTHIIWVNFSTSSQQVDKARTIIWTMIIPYDNMNKHFHDAYQRALPTSGDGVVRIFEKIVGTPPLPTDKEAYEVYMHLLEDLRRMENFEKRYPLAIVAFGSARLSTDNPYYLLAVEVGERLAQRGYLVRTGAG